MNMKAMQSIMLPAGKQVIGYDIDGRARFRVNTCEVRPGERFEVSDHLARELIAAGAAVKVKSVLLDPDAEELI